jgi:hypothetical protein
MNMILFLSALLNVADAKKNKGGDSEPEAKTEAASNEVSGDIPNDGTSKKFAKQLTSTSISNFSPDAQGLNYKTMTFNSDNTWKADAVVSVMDEEMECLESGTWKMDPANSNTVSNMNWTIDTTDCPTRQAPMELRVEVTIVSSEAGIHVNFR